MLLMLIQTSEKEMPRLLPMVKDDMGLLQLRKSIGTRGTSIGGAWWERIDLGISGTSVSYTHLTLPTNREV